jgi:hypothetical protein
MRETRATDVALVSVLSGCEGQGFGTLMEVVTFFAAL